MKKLAIFALSLAAICSVNACSDNDDNSTVGYKPIDITSRQLALTKATSCDDYRDHLLDGLAMAIAEERFEGGYHYKGWDDVESVANDTASPDSAADGGSAGEYTTTNVQEAGVDELDSVKNDGNYMYTIRDEQIHISKIWPVTEMKEVATIEREKLVSDKYTDRWFSPRGIFLTDDKKLIDIGESYTWHYSEDGYWYGHYSGLVSVRVFDVSNPADPKLLKSHQIEGEFVDARLIDNRLHLISSATPQFRWRDVYKLSEEDIPGVPKWEYESDFFDEDGEWSEEKWQAYRDAEDEWFSHSQENIEKYAPVIRAWLDEKYPDMLSDYHWPNYYDGQNARPAVACTDLYIPAVASQKEGFLLVSEFTGNNYENYKATAIADDGWTVYASQKNLYISSFSYNWWWSCGEEECQNYTHIHHFNLGNQAGDVQYINSAEIDGVADDPFFYSEYNDHLRVVSNPEAWGNSPKGHILSVLDVNTPRVMKQTGVVKGFGKDESIYSARMVGDRGYVVTFRNTDPLFVFDLSDPANPKQAGELKINGYSSYIHPVGKDHLLTIGEDGDENGRMTGMKLDLYDVSNPAKPVLKYQTKINEEEYESDGETSSGSYGWSEALYNHHAFQYHEGSGLLAVPVNISKWTDNYKTNSYTYKHFSGMFVYRVKPDSDFEFVGGVDHADLVPGDDSYWWTSVQRSRFYFKTAGVYDKDAYIYTISNHGLKASDANEPDKTFGVIKY